MKDFKIALFFYGHLRTFRECLPSVLNHLIKNYDCDVFMHTWDEYERITESWHNSDILPNKISLDDIEFIKTLFPNFTWITEHQNNLNNSERTGFSRSHESLLKSLLLKKQTYNNKKYDIYVITRPDILFLKEIDIELISKMLNDNFFDNRLVQASYNYQTPSMWNNDSYGGRDCLMFSNNQLFEKLIQIKPNDHIFKIPNFINRKGEAIFDNILMQCGINAEIIKIFAPEFWAIKRKGFMIE